MDIYWPFGLLDNVFILATVLALLLVTFISGPIRMAPTRLNRLRVRLVIVGLCVMVLTTFWWVTVRPGDEPLYGVLILISATYVLSQFVSAARGFLSRK